jgi:hypothetical protein
MTQREQQQWQPVDSSTNWLSTLVDTFEQAEQLGDVCCDDRLLSEMRARLRGRRFRVTEICSCIPSTRLFAGHLKARSLAVFDPA